MKGFWASIVEGLARERKDLICLAREADQLLAALNWEGIDPDSPRGQARTNEIFRCRSALARRRPVTPLDGLMLIMLARQAVTTLRSMDPKSLDEARQTYWTGELDDALQGIQLMFEVDAGVTLEELGFSTDGCGMSLN